MTPTPTPVPSAAASALDLLDRSRHSLLEACHTRDIVQRHRQAQLAALRAAAVVAARTRPGGPAGPRSLWELVPSVAPELAEWAGFFELVAARPGPHTAREADDLLRQSETFLELVCRTLGLPVTAVDRDVLVPTVAASAVSAAPGASAAPVRGGGSP
ncbi:SAV_6107 family HEPN domain-containing protein [Pedococcus sp. NPDC057267]|uniref:SAV_6107 family HEPN domain-containing protein n=1 Tax=Pedococcus sp. NPDC057267 TaxID=3346077 RepID=UPI00363C12A0